MTLSTAVLALAVLPTLSLGPVESRTTLSSLRHDYRPLLVFAASESEQRRMLAGHAAEMRERQMVLVPIVPRKVADAGSGDDGLPEELIVRLTASEEVAAERRFHIGDGEFTVILIGKDGGEKLRSRSPVGMERLIEVIDAMPMRQKEARSGHHPG